VGNACGRRWCWRLKTSDKVKGVVVAAGGVTALAPCRQPSQIGRRRLGLAASERTGAKRGASVGEYRRLPGRILAGYNLRWFRPAAAGAVGGGGRITSRQERSSPRGERIENAYGRERGRGMPTGWPTKSDKDQKRPNTSDSTIGKWPQNTGRRLRLKL
jgi:hypothetical protein